MLVVVLIIGIVMSFVSLSLDPTGPADRLQTEATRLNALSHAAADDAVLGGYQIGLDITGDGYRFLRYGNTGWQPITATDSPLRPRSLGPGLQLTRVIRNPHGKPHLGLFPQRSAMSSNDGANSDSRTSQAAKDRRDAVHPDAVFLASGEIVPFTFELSADGVPYHFDLTGQANGTMSLKKVSARQ